VVEEDDDVRDLAREVLESAGYPLLGVSHPGEAERIAAEHPGPIHLLITDPALRSATGGDLAARLRHWRPGLRVLYLSGGGAPGGTAPVLAKPFRPAELAGGGNPRRGFRLTAPTPV